MKVIGDNAPSAAFTIEAQPKKPGFVLVRFYENVTEYSSEADGFTINGYRYDEYYLELADTGDLKSEIARRYDYYLKTAKLQEPADSIEELRTQLGDISAAFNMLLEVLA